MFDENMPLVCICIPSYNAEKTIGATLDSILAQTYSNLLIQIVDNDSSDDTVAIVQGYDDPRIRLHHNSVNLGGEGNFNRCIELSTGKYTAIYHADDIYETGMVAAQVEFLESNPSASAVFTEASLINESGELIGAIHQPASLAATGPLHDFTGLFRAILEHSNFLICPSVMALTSVYQDQIKCWRGEMFGSSADLDVWLRMSLAGPIGIIPEKKMRYRISSQQGSAQLRLNVDRAPFFKVIDYYLGQERVTASLTRKDWVHYQRLEQRDRVMRATNALVAKQPSTAIALCPSLISVAMIGAALQTRRGKVVFALGMFIKLTIALRLHDWSSSVLLRLKRIAQK